MDSYVSIDHEFLSIDFLESTGVLGQNAWPGMQGKVRQPQPVFSRKQALDFSEQKRAGQLSGKF